jgi:ABC-type sugar transport system substrate-binding protein
MQRVDAIVLAPLVETRSDPVLREANRAKISVIITDRTIQTSDESLFVCFIGSDFFEEGRMAAEWLAKAVNGTGRIVELQGTPGSAPANDRRKAFAEGIAKYPGLKIIDSQSGDFRRAGGKEVMEASLKKHGRNIDIVYAPNDDIALGAVQAIEVIGLKPGVDIKIIAIDALREGVQAVVDGKIITSSSAIRCSVRRFTTRSKRPSRAEKCPRKRLTKTRYSIRPMRRRRCRCVSIDVNLICL